MKIPQLFRVEVKIGGESIADLIEGLETLLTKVQSIDQEQTYHRYKITGTVVKEQASLTVAKSTEERGTL